MVPGGAPGVGGEAYYLGQSGHWALGCEDDEELQGWIAEHLNAEEGPMALATAAMDKDNSWGAGAWMFGDEPVTEPAALYSGEKPEVPPDRQENSNCRSALTYGRTVCIAVGDDVCTDKVLRFAARYICKPQDSVSLVHISKSNSTAAAASKQLEQAGKASSNSDARLLEGARATLLRFGKVGAENITTKALPPSPKGKHVGQALVDHCLSARVHILVIGNRGLTGMKLKLDSIVKEGSVSKYVADHLPRYIAVVVVRPPEGHDWGNKG